MPFDRNTTQTKPPLPRVANTKSPLTPRLAAQHIKAVVNPGSSTRPALVSTIVKDDLPTPAKPFIAGNITPRSSSRKSRLESGSASSTPTTATRPKSTVVDTGFTRPHALSPASSPGTRSPLESNGSFFHASDAKKIESQPQPPQPKKAATFFYANGARDEDVNPIPSPPASAVGISSKPYSNRMNGVPRTPTSPELENSSRPASLIGFPMRPPSPQKTNIHLTYRKGASQIISPPSRPQAVPIMPPNNSARSPSPGRPASNIAAQLNATPQQNHNRTASIGSVDSSPSSRKSSSNAVTKFDSSPKSVRIAPNPSATLLPPNEISAPQSPTHFPQTTSFAEAAANARRERKVMDLEISNSSLLAINRSLEREIRKQKAELRRFRRLSRAGRLSSITMESKIVDDDTENMVQINEDENEFSDSDADEDPDSSMSDESLDSSSFSAADTARLEKDEKRLQLDLNKHRQLLVDSQKMNLSLKRCMAMSEDMIAEARRALEYRVRVSDVKLGGRILHHDGQLSELGEEESFQDNEGETDQRNALLGAWTPPDGTTPIAMMPGSNSDEEIFGLALKMNGSESSSPLDEIPNIIETSPTTINTAST